MAEPHEMTAVELSRAFRDGDLSPVEVTQGLLARIEALDSEVNAFCLIDTHTTLAQAEASEQRWAEGNPLSPLDGVPVAVKDLLVTKGWATRRGSYSVDPNAYIDTMGPPARGLAERG